MLLMKGFNFDFYTQVKDHKGWTYKFCYEWGYKIKPIDENEISKLDDNYLSSATQSIDLSLTLAIQMRALGLGTNPELDERIRPFINAKDLTATPREVYIIDMFQLTEAEVRSKFPEVYQHLCTKVKPERDHNRDKAMRENWWLF